MKWKIDLTSLVTKSYSKREVRDKVRSVIASDSFKRLFGDMVITQIADNTTSGVDKKGRAFKPYKKSYKNSFIFEVYGKSSNVNLELTGDMLSSMEAVPIRNAITIQFTDEENAAKAHGHINGGNFLPVRDFFGLPEDELIDAFKDAVLAARNEDLETAMEDTVTTSFEVGVDEPEF